MKVNTKIDYLIRYIDKHPEMSGHQVYNHFKGTKHGIRKTDFYKVYRGTKGLPKPSPEKRLKATPKKYRKKVELEIKKEKEIQKRLDTVPSGKQYNHFFTALEDLVYDKMNRKPDNYRDLQHKMYDFKFNAGFWPSNKQVETAWAYLRSKGLTTR